LGEQQTSLCRGAKTEFDPTATLAAPNGSALNAGFSPYERTCLNR